MMRVDGYECELCGFRVVGDESMVGYEIGQVGNGRRVVSPHKADKHLCSQCVSVICTYEKAVRESIPGFTEVGCNDG